MSAKEIRSQKANTTSVGEREDTLNWNQAKVSAFIFSLKLVPCVRGLGPRPRRRSY